MLFFFVVVDFLVCLLGFFFYVFFFFFFLFVFWYFYFPAGYILEQFALLSIGLQVFSLKQNKYIVIYQCSFWVSIKIKFEIWLTI